ncbi:hypothetical protein ACWD3I_25490 [Streptomyces sp. NPDC002817]|uniref:hypothetical protein n=1 Tax=Streptomyces sp. NPDC088357 TaxID=3154655 RepID=UPI003427C196
MPQTLHQDDPLVRLLSAYRSMSDRHKAALDPYVDTDGYVDEDHRRAYNRRDRTDALEARPLLEQAMDLLTGRFTLPDGMAVTVPGSDHHAYTVTTGRLDDRAREAFRHGQCHAFARALCDETGWKMAVILSGSCSADPDLCSMEPVASDVCGCQLEHLVAVRPDGAHVDITGAHLPGTLQDYEDQEAVMVTDTLWAFILRSPAWRRPAIDVARTFVPPLLASLDDRTEVNA